MDPEFERYKRNFPRFPGVEICVDLMHQRNTQGAYLDALLADLEAHALEVSAELISAFRAEADSRIRALLLAALAQAQIHEASLVFVECLTGPEEELRAWAAYGLRNLGTKEARQILWQARSHRFSDSDETMRFQKTLEEIKQWK